jgi:hypothetical protein
MAAPIDEEEAAHAGVLSQPVRARIATANDTPDPAHVP